MAAKGYRYYGVTAFPDWEVGHVFETTHQDSLIRDLVDEAPKTVITASGLADHPDFRKYHVMHEAYRTVTGRYRNEPIPGYIAQVEFHIFWHPIVNRLFVDANRKLCDEMVDRLEKSPLDFLVIPQEIDLRRLAHDMKADVRGGWFRELKVADVSTIGLFGSTVGESSEWDRYDQLGRLKSIDIEFEEGDQRFPVKIGSDRGVVLYSTFTESGALGFVLEVQQILDHYLFHPQS